MPEEQVDVNASIEKQVESSSTATESASKNADAKHDNNMIPRTRYNEVSSAFQEAKKTWETEKTDILTQLKDKDKTVTNLSGLLKEAKEAQDIVKAIQDLSKDPKHADLVIKLDSILQGEEEEETVESKSDTDLQKSQKNELHKVRKEMAEALDEQREEMLITKADTIAAQYLANLPVEYNEKDRDIVSRMWADVVDWDEVKANPDKLGDILADSLEKTLANYGEPRGKLETLIKDFQSKQTKEEDITHKQESVSEQLKSLVDKDWGKLKTIKTPTGEKIVPETSDADFAAALAKAIRLGNQM